MHLGMVECRVPFMGHCDLDLGFRKIVSGTYRYIIKGGISIFCVYMHLGMVECQISFSDHCDLNLT